MFKDVGHLIRLSLLLLVGVLLFILLRGIAVPEDYGRYGAFRPQALEANAARPLSYAGHAACEGCHADVVEARQGSKHAGIHCEICHGPAAIHADDPDAAKPLLPNARTLCLGCHAVDVARPAGFPQIDAADHAPEGLCTDCHSHHHPEL